MEIKNLKHLLIQIAEVNKRFEREAQISGENFNIFRILRLESSENRLHSAFLTELLNPYGSHGHKDTFLKLFLTHTLIGEAIIDFDTISAQAKQEDSLGQIDESGFSGGRVDISITDSKNRCILIENKIYAKDQNNQLLRYHKSSPSILFYLTLNGRPADYSSAGQLIEGQDYFTISYKDHILHWLEACRKEAAMQPILRESITQYINLIKHLTNQTINEMKETNIAEILISNTENLKSAFAIQRAIHESKSLLLVKLRIEIEQLAKNLNLESSFDENLSSIYSGFAFYCSNWKSTGLGFEFGRSNMNDLIYGFYHNDIPNEERLALNALIKERLNGKTSTTWSFYKSFNFKNWDYEDEAWIAIENGKMIKLIKETVESLMEKTIDIQHKF